MYFSLLLKTLLHKGANIGFLDFVSFTLKLVFFVDRYNNIWNYYYKFVLKIELSSFQYFSHVHLKHLRTTDQIMAI